MRWVPLPPRRRDSQKDEHRVLPERQGDLSPAPTQHLSLLGKTQCWARGEHFHGIFTLGF